MSTGKKLLTRAKNVSIKKIRKTKGKRMTKDERKTEEQRLLGAIQGFSEMSETSKAVFLKLLKNPTLIHVLEAMDIAFEVDTNNKLQAKK